MAVVRIREAARRDITAQWVWYAENAGIETAERFLDAVEATARMLSGQPESGIRTAVANRQLGDMRRFPAIDGFEAMLLFYLPSQDGIELVRGIRGSRDLRRLFSTSDV
jgi:toxin ParE1/3/4